MTAKSTAIGIVKDLGVPELKAVDLVESIIEAVKEELCSGELKWEHHEPELIQGYTAEQWQVIIDGGYLCEFSDRLKFQASWFNVLASRDGDSFEDCDGDVMSHCRPAQIKGVLRPIWIEPVGDPHCHFFSEDIHVGRRPWSRIPTRADSYMEI